jgi:hypothetical protein
MSESGWDGVELAPSTMRGDDPRFARLVGFLGLSLVLFGALILLSIVFSQAVAAKLSPSWGIFAVVSGVTMLLVHAALDPDLQIRRTYGLLGYFWLVAAVLFVLIPRPYVGALFLPYSFICLTLGLLFLAPFLRNETDPVWRTSALNVIGGVALLLTLVGFIGGVISQAFLVGGEAGRPYGVMLILVGLAYSWVFLILQGSETKRGGQAAVALGGVGLVVLLVALGRSILPALFYSWGWLATRPSPYFVPAGLVLCFLGLCYVALSACLRLDFRIVVLFRRELGAFFYSPIAYVVLLCFTIISAVVFNQFVDDLSRPALMGAPIPEPIITF